MKLLKTTLKELGFSKNEAIVYLALTELGEAKGVVIAKRAGLSRTTALSILDRLVKNGFVTSHKYKGSVYYWVESPAVIEETFKNKACLAQSLSETLSSMYRTGHNFPTAKTFDTKEGIKTFTEKLLLSTEVKEIFTIDAPHIGNYQKIFSNDFYNILLGIKTQKAILTKTLVTKNTKSKINPEKIQHQNIEIREMPNGIVFDASIWIVGETIVLFSGKPPFLVAFKHDLITKSFKSLFSYMWECQKPV